MRAAWAACEGLGQPFYKSNVRGWTKLTYSQQNLDCNVKARQVGAWER